MENNEISVRKRGGEDLGSMSIEAFVKLVNNATAEE
jgi:threonyl-tRNA synthetase